MEIIISENYDALSKRIAADTAAILNSLAHPLFCPTSGDTPAGLYKELVQLQADKTIDFSIIYNF